MPVKKVKEYLENNNIKYVVIKHSPAYTAQEIAALSHIPGKEMAKTTVVKIDGRMAMVVLPASYRVNFELLKEAAGTEKVELAAEDEFKDHFPGCEPGAMPPFGNLFNMHVIMAQSLADQKDIVFNAGNHRELIKMACSDYLELVKPKICKCSDKQYT